MDIRELINQKVIEAGAGIPQIVAQNLAQAEIDRRVGILTKAFLKQEELTKAFKKLNVGDKVMYSIDANGQPTKRLEMTEERYNAINKSRETLSNFSKVIEVALTENTTEAYKKLEEQLEKVKGGEPAK